MRNLDSAELTEWMAYYTIEPFGEQRADLRAGIIASTLVNMNRAKSSKAVSPREFMPFIDDDTKQKLASKKLRDALKRAHK